MSATSDTPTTTDGRDDETEVLLECDAASINRGKREVVHAASCALRKGEFVALLGPNGAGKSTLLDALSGSRGAACCQRQARPGVAGRAARPTRRPGAR